MTGVIDDLIRQLRMAAAKAKRTKDRTGDTTTVYFAMPAYVALLAASRLEQTQDRMKATSKLRADMLEASDIAENAMKDTALRFAYAMTDLEILLMEAVGRQPMTMQEVREQRQITEARPSPQPFIRKKPSVQISPELSKSIRQRRIGNPRDPGQDG
jgi:hypothetical protein